MGKLQPHEVVEYLDKHVPYRVNIMLAQYRIALQHLPVSKDINDACYIASLVTARMFLNMLGIGKDFHATRLLCFKPLDTDVCVDDMGGTLIDPATLPSADQDLLLNFLKMADQAAAHFTVPINHNWQMSHKVILLVYELLKVNLYDRVGRRIPPI